MSEQRPLRIVMGFPMEDKQTGIYIRDAFNSLGHMVCSVDDPRTHDPINLLQSVRRYKPDFVFIAKDPRYNNIIEEIAELSTTVMWNMDVRYDINIFLNTCGPLYEHCHLKFIIGDGNLSKYMEKGIENIFWLSEGISPAHHFKPTNIIASDYIRYECEVAFAGSVSSFHDGRAEVMKALRDSDFDFEHFQGVFNEDHNKLVTIAHVNLGQSGWPKVKLSMSARDYRIMGAGGFLLTNHVEGIDEWFDIGEMCDTYRTTEECLDKVKFYLNKSTLREKIALRGMEEVHKKHKFTDRLKILIEKVRDFGGFS